MYVEADRFAVVRLATQPVDLFRLIATLPVAELDTVLQTWLSDAYIQDALALSSPTLHRRLREALVKTGEISEFRPTILKYLIRMTTRATPFGLFAGVAMVNKSVSTAIDAASTRDAYRVTRIDMSFLTAVRKRVREAHRDAPCVANPTLRRVGDKFHYTESFEVDGLQRYRLSSVDADEFVITALEAVNRAQTPKSIAKGLALNHQGVDAEDALDFVNSMKAEGLLTTEIRLPVTAPSPEIALAEAMTAMGAEAEAKHLLAAIGALKLMDEGASDRAIVGHRALEATKHLIPDRPEGQLFQTDLAPKLLSATFASNTLDDLVEAMPLMMRPKKLSPMVRRFIDEFNVRHEGTFIPLLHALDEQVGFFFGQATQYENPLLNGMEAHEPSNDSSGKSLDLSPLQHRLVEALRVPARWLAQSLDLKKIDAGGLSHPFSDAAFSFSILSSLYFDESGEKLHYKDSSGPSGMNLIGRFCHLDPTLLEAAREHLRKEEAHSPDVVFAEIIHLPQGRAGNILSRPVLSEFEIEFLGESSLPEAHRIPIGDLWVGVKADEIVLWSRKLSKRVVPRLSTAHNFTYNAMTPYRFLALIAGQTRGVPNFTLPDAVANFRVIPRITYGNVILHPRQWILPRRELEPLTDARTNEAALNFLKATYDITNVAAYSVRDNILTIDLRNPELVRLLLSESRGQAEVILREAFIDSHTPASSQLCNGSPKPVVNEIVFPFINAAARPHACIRVDEVRYQDNALRTHFAPATEWLSLKIYGGSSILDSMLLTAVAPLAQKLIGTSTVQEFFFIRYADPDFHLRLRFRGDPSILLNTVMPLINDTLGQFLDSRVIDRIEVFTYFPEWHRYGGPNGLPLAERLFSMDSIEVLTFMHGVSQADRWKLALLSTSAFLEKFGLTVVESLDLVSRLRNAFGREFGDTGDTRRNLGRRYRSLGAEEVLEGEPQKKLLDSLRKINRTAIREIGATFRERAAAGELERPIGDILASVLHMKMNRLFITDTRRNEFVIYDFLRRHFLKVSKTQQKSDT